MKKINILVTGTGSLIGQSIIKAIRNSDISNDVNIIGCDYFSKTIGSLWCDKNYIIPDILKKNNQKIWLKNIIEIIKENNVLVLFIGVDFELIPFAKNKIEIESQTNCKVIVSNLNLLKIGNDKYLTYQFLKKNNFNYPKTFLPKNFNSLELKFPLIIKPRIGARSRDVFKVNNKKELKEKISKIKNPIIQEYLGDENNEYTCGVLMLENKIVDMMVLKRSLKNGNTQLSEHKFNFPKEIYQYIKAVSNKLEPYGSCNFQIRFNKNNQPCIFEINPRFSGTTYMRCLFGFNEVEYIIKFLLNYPNKSFNMKEGLAYRFFEEKLL